MNGNGKITKKAKQTGKLSTMIKDESLVPKIIKLHLKLCEGEECNYTPDSPLSSTQVEALLDEVEELRRARKADKAQNLKRIKKILTNDE